MDVKERQFGISKTLFLNFDSAGIQLIRTRRGKIKEWDKDVRFVIGIITPETTKLRDILNELYPEKEPKKE